MESRFHERLQRGLVTRADAGETAWRARRGTALSRLSYPEVPPRVEYELTGLGGSLRPVLEQMSGLGRNAPGRGGSG